MKSLLKEKILHSGIIFTALSFISGLGNFVFQGIIGRRLEAGEYGFANAADTFTGLLGLPLLMASQAVIHHIAHFRGTNNEARLQGLLTACRSFLLKFTVVACVLGVVLIQPLSHYFEIPRASVTMAALVSLIIALWSGYASALAQGMGWFKRLALIGLAGVMVRIVFVWIVTNPYPKAEASVIAVAAGTLLNLAVFFWWRDLFKPGERVSPWDRDFFRYLAVAAAGVGAQYCFTKGDVLVASKYFSADDLGAYSAAAKISSALHFAVSPLLLVLFTARSGARAGKSLSGPLGLLLLYAAGLAAGAVILFFTANLCVLLIFNRPFPAAAAMIPRLATTMIFVGLIQALGMWALASHWLKVGLLYGVVGVVYWTTLLGVAHQTTPPVAHTAVRVPGSGQITLTFTAEPATSYRIFHKFSTDARFTEAVTTNFNGPTATAMNYISDAGTNAAPSQFKVVRLMNPATLLNIMPLIAAGGFAIMLVAWLVMLRRGRAANAAN